MNKMNEFFNIPKIEYGGKDSTNPLAFKYYNPDEIINGKPLREQRYLGGTKYAVMVQICSALVLPIKNGAVRIA